ncbi:MAG: ATP-dependent helicase, partial [Anaerolineales bacterium]
MDQFFPRPAQKDILTYRGGTMGVSAVPGSGKTWTLSYLAAELIYSGCLQDDQEVLVVTLVNSAVINFSQRISSFLAGFGLLPSLGYRVRTLHGLAHDIVKERPELAGLDNSFQIIDEREADRIREDAVYNWLQKNPHQIDSYLLEDLNTKKIESLLQKQIPDLLNQISLQFIRTAKNLQLSPKTIQKSLESSIPDLPLVNLGLDIYSAYQRNLEFRGAVDFDDLINKAYQDLTYDSALLDRLQDKWPFILEDEAQDSSLLQQRILGLLADQRNQKNWVRVGDPNQAIYESFTTADPKLLNEFISSADRKYLLPNSGRNTNTIISLANYLVDWCNNDHPTPEVRDALYPNKILPTPEGDYQPNPESNPDQIHLHDEVLSPDKELALVGSSVSRWLEKNPHKTAAVLVPRNDRGKKIAGLLRDQFNIEPVELLNSTLATRKTTGSLVRIMSYLIDPGSSKKLAAVYEVWKRELQTNQAAWSDVKNITTLLLTIKEPELFLSPGPSPDWLISLSDVSEDTIKQLTLFRQIITKWHQAILLPVDQLILTIAGDIFFTPDELSLYHKIATFQKQLSTQHPDWELPSLLDELKSLARNERRFFAGGEGDQFKPEEHKGKVVITTAHKAKGLEWDRVYLMSANNYNFPSGSSEDSYISEKWFI